jgi:hypothetical protein
MSELGKEILPLFEEGEWRLDEYRMTHMSSGLVFWVCNDRHGFRLYDIKGLPYHDESYRTALNSADKFVLWDAYQKILESVKAKPTEAALNMVRMHKMKGEVK